MNLSLPSPAFATAQLRTRSEAASKAPGKTVKVGEEAAAPRPAAGQPPLPGVLLGFI